MILFLKIGGAMSVSSLKEFTNLFKYRSDAARALGVSHPHLSMALKRDSNVIVEHDGKKVLSAKIQIIKEWGGKL